MRAWPPVFPSRNSHAWKLPHDAPRRMRRRSGAGVDHRARMGDRAFVAHAIAPVAHENTGRRCLPCRARRRSTGRKQLARRRGWRRWQCPAIDGVERYPCRRLSDPALSLRRISADTGTVAGVSPRRFAERRAWHHRAVAGPGLADRGSAQAAGLAGRHRRTGFRRIRHRATGAAERRIQTVPLRLRGAGVAVVAWRPCRIDDSVVRLRAVGAALDQRVGAGSRHLRYRLAIADPWSRRCAEHSCPGNDPALAVATPSARHCAGGAAAVGRAGCALAARFFHAPCADRTLVRGQELG